MKKINNQIENIDKLEKIINKYIGGAEAAEAIKQIKDRMEIENSVMPFYYIEIGRYIIDCLEFKLVRNILNKRNRLIGREYSAEGVIIYKLDDDHRLCNLIINTYKNTIWAA